MPNPLQCFQCRKFGHHQERCRNDRKCLLCGKSRHEGGCETKCINCDQVGHSCRSRDCPVWLKEKDICTLKVENEIPYSEARRRYETTHKPPTLQSFADVVRVPSERVRMGDSDLREKVEKLEQKIDQLSAMLVQLTSHLSTNTGQQGATNNPSGKSPAEKEVDKEVVVEEGETMEIRNDAGSKGTAPVYKTREGQPHESRNRKSKEKGVKDPGRDRSMDVESDATNDEIPSQVLPKRSISAERYRAMPTLKKSWKPDSKGQK